jgi:hypothetical protein
LRVRRLNVTVCNKVAAYRNLRSNGMGLVSGLWDLSLQR